MMQLEKCLLTLAVLLSIALVGCSLETGASDRHDNEALTAVTGSAHTIEFDAYVYVPTDATDEAVQAAIRMQVKSSLGALKELEIGIEDREVRHSVDPSELVRTTLTVVEPDGTTSGTIDRVTYRYIDRALVRHSPDAPIELHLLFGDYVSRVSELIPECSDDADADPGSFWYHFTPGRWRCQRAIANEESVIAAASLELDDPSNQLSRAELDRRFLTVRATLTPHETPPELYPEYHRIFESSSDEVLAYAFFGVDSDVRSPRDHGLRETLRFQRSLRRSLPGLRLARVRPGADLRHYAVGGELVEDVAFDDIERWIVDEAGYPPEVGSDASLRDELLQQVVDRYAERWVEWELPVDVRLDGETHSTTVIIRTFYGEEDGSHEIRERARGRYLEAFWHGTVFAYTGHSHFGYGPLNPDRYDSWDFPERYQVMLINSCLSYNYYDADFLEMHPGGTENLDVVVNGLPAYWPGMGQSTAAYIAGLLDGNGRSWRQLLESMRVDLPWELAYDPMRAVNGELDNVYSPVDTPLIVDDIRDEGDWQRTVILVEAITEPGQDMFIRGGIDHGAARELLGVDCGADLWACAIPIRHLNLHNPTTSDWKQGDRFLDWHGPEDGQSGGSHGSPADWTTDHWPSEWGTARTVELDGFGVEVLNEAGPHYWMLDAEMDCGATIDGWFELKAYVARGEGWESNVHQPGAPYLSGNHFGRCGELNTFRFGEDEAEISPFD